MPVVRDISIHLDPEETALTANRGRPNPQVAEKVHKLLENGDELWQPAIVYDWVEVMACEPPLVRLAVNGSEAELKVGPMANLMDRAKEVMIFALTIGPALGKEVDRLQAEGNYVDSYLLDSIGVLAQGEVGKHGRAMVTEKAAEKGWGISYHTAPGSLRGWNVKGQRDLCNLLPLDEIGMRLTDSGLLEPFKSSAGMVGIGPDYESKIVRSACKWCGLRETCWRRRRDEDD